MEPAPLIALAIAVAIALIAILPTRCFGERKGRPASDANAGRRDGDAAATWIGIRAGRGMNEDAD